MNDAQRQRLEQQIAFIMELDKMKQILRQNYVTGQTRKENDAEHSWHMALMAMVLSEYAKESVNIGRVMKLVLLHDIVEIDAGDTYCYDTQGLKDKLARETSAADHIFGLLPEDQGKYFRELWEEFEYQTTPEAKIAAALDRLQPLLLHVGTQGRSWQEHAVTSDKVVTRNSKTKEISPLLGELVQQIIEDCIAKGYLAK